jgi:hypothetical protein
VVTPRSFAQTFRRRAAEGSSMQLLQEFSR